jgi:riboflavin kinase/FMN adenylyltransferase
MTIIEGLEGFRTLPPGAVMSIGNFDGIHRGHRSLLAMAEGLRSPRGMGVPPMSAAPDPGAAQLDPVFIRSCAAYMGGTPMPQGETPMPLVVVTFEPHPLTVLRPEAVPPRLTPLAVKRAILEAAGVDTLVLLPPSRDLLDLSAEQFWQLLVSEVRPAHLIEGESFTFGKGRGGTLEKLRQWAVGSGIELHVAQSVHAVLLNLSVVSVSSSLIRWLISQGRVRDAAICLGRPYALEGIVVKGNQRGRTIGTPTANLDVTDQLVPADGVYAGRAVVDQISYRAAVSIGTLPTFDGATRQVEAHLLDFTAGDLYGRGLCVELTDWLRDQRKFSGVDALKVQIADDLIQVGRRAALDPSREIGVETLA